MNTFTASATLSLQTSTVPTHLVSWISYSTIKTLIRSIDTAWISLNEALFVLLWQFHKLDTFLFHWTTWTKHAHLALQLWQLKHFSVPLDDSQLDTLYWSTCWANLNEADFVLNDALLRSTDCYKLTCASEALLVLTSALEEPQRFHIRNQNYGDNQ